MADYYISTHFRLNASKEEVAALIEIDSYDNNTDGKSCNPSSIFINAFPPINEDKLSGYRAYLEQMGEWHDANFSECIYTTYDGTFYKNEEMNEGYVCDIIQRICKSALPVIFTWAGASAPSRPDAFGGGLIRIEHDNINYFRTLDMLETFRDIDL